MAVEMARVVIALIVASAWALSGENSARRPTTPKTPWRRAAPTRRRPAVPRVDNTNPATTRRTETSTTKFDAAAACRAQASNDEAAAVMRVPRRLRRDNHAASSVTTGPVFRYASLDEVRPGLSAAFADPRFRDELRTAGRRDLTIRYNSAVANDLSASAEGSWRAPRRGGDDDDDEDDARDSSDYCPNLTEALRNAGFADFSGRDFLHALGGLSLPGVEAKAHTGNWMEIVGVKNRRVDHSWHQDSHGDDAQLTIMLGFPPLSSNEARDDDDDDDDDGQRTLSGGGGGACGGGATGVFSHVLQLSHTIRPPDSLTSVRGPRLFDPAEFALRADDKDDDEDRDNYGVVSNPADLVFPEATIIRPRFKRGQEIIVYSDALTLHSAPDVAHREAIWRLM